MIGKKYNTLTEKQIKKRASNKRYAQSEKGKAARKKYYTSEQGRENLRKYMKKYMKTEKGKAARKRYFDSERGKAIVKKYNTSDRGRALRKLSNLKRKYGNSRDVKFYTMSKEEQLKNMNEYAKKLLREDKTLLTRA